MANNQNFFMKWVNDRFGGKPEQTAESVTVSEAASSKKNNVLKKIGLAFVTGSKGGRATFEGPQGFDFEEIEKAYLTDSYIRGATDKYVDFMFKAGWDVAGKNPAAVEYINLRLAAMAQATMIPSEELLIEIAEELIKYHNVFIVKARASNSYSFPPGIRVSPLDGKKPVAGYFVLPTATISIARETNGTVKKYQQDIAGGDKIEFKPEDVIHIAIDRQPGRAFGFPFLWEVLDDVKLLRQLEELTDRMIYKNIFPLMVYQVGLEKEGLQSTDDEIEEVREILGELTLDGGIVLPERHNIKVVGAEGAALQVGEYLKYFEERVFTGLGVSGTLMGRGDTANRSTSDNIDAVFKDRIKAYQKILAVFINAFMMNELLVEGGFDPVLNIQDKVEFRFKEIDFDSKIKEENHAIQKFTQNAITHEELRNILGLDPVTDEGRLYFNMITASLNAQAAQEKAESANAAGQNKNQPTNQHGTKTSPKKKENLNESLNTINIEDIFTSLNIRWEMAKSEVISIITKKGNLTEKNIGLIANMTSQSMRSILEKNVGNAYIKGIEEFNMQSQKTSNVGYGYNVQHLNDEAAKKLNKLAEDLVKQVLIAKDKGEAISDKAANVAGAFNALKYRLKFIINSETYKAYNLGFSKAARDAGVKELEVSNSDNCEDGCLANGSKSINLYTDNLPPFHPNCQCKLILPTKEGGN